jgi:3'(2'), 5'-bisphosphate nucleotidase
VTANPDLFTAAVLDELTRIASEAAGQIMRLRVRGGDVREKPDSSPVTDADEAAEALILERLRALAPNLVVISEESFSRGQCREPGAVFALVDPLDGTREFVAGRDEFTVNIALVKDGRALAGIIGAPARGVIWRGLVGQGAERLRLEPGASPGRALERRTIYVRREAKPRIALVSRSHPDPATEAFLGRYPGVERAAYGSSLKFGLLAEGAADIYPRLAPTHEWDICAGDAIVTAAGGTVLSPGGAPIAYGRAGDLYLVPAFIARAKAAD